MIPYLIYGGFELEFGILILGLCLFFGLFILLLWVPGEGRKSEHAIDMIRFGYHFIVAGVIGFLFSSWFLIACILAFLVYLSYLVVKGIKVLRDN